MNKIDIIQIFVLIYPVCPCTYVHLKVDNVNYLKKPSWNEKHCPMLVRLFWLFQCSRTTQWDVPVWFLSYSSVYWQHSSQIVKFPRRLPFKLSSKFVVDAFDKVIGKFTSIILQQKGMKCASFPPAPPFQNPTTTTHFNWNGFILFELAC